MLRQWVDDIGRTHREMSRTRCEKCAGRGFLGPAEGKPLKGAAWRSSITNESKQAKGGRR